MSSIYSSEYQLVIKNLREIRIKKGITHERLAQALKRPQSFVAKVESGERRLDVIEFAYIAGLLGIEPAPLLQKILVKVAPL
ncbi:TPA: helix-turn-helix transcriptional regulator [Klebsiella pneumoniae]|uniref:helix-turn-helix domain-containing protein n=1 Tax=Klebsiella pneumoniae TaxID=573 RepID=UPI001CD6B08C|nr:helix-turn-helix transcriptional regulator [Klebsiella pneumoniae]MCJ7072771.1 helix-turn-helix domain-containing protein [Klebsiella pneumoniae]HBQ9101511.1 helix-turn-helix transcriptional regulator [Klebsiella pneumoniae]HBQ9118632.1 helix-turn-helix transcriptional regulator [Klebsiella pneumoniae]HBQ9140757.1 helix-turn-helix transcriptional regulator [Klebsiella pneumoniae]HBQ9242266.1 helix-turn-helix transcriptional regulator [Klebsiella pneumoniae]